MKVKVGDKVRVIAGSDKGKEGNVQKVLKNTNRVIVTGVHIVKKHVKPGRTNETGGILEVEAPIHASNVKVLESSKREKAKTEKKVEKAKKEQVKETKKATKKEVVANIQKDMTKKAITKNTRKNAVTKKVGGN
ncbi:MAG: 50S ribosomal protein L24 [Mollicutes bacterium]|jgi:large subunit ribosomal protein L24|nr:50S ribosomal protein L24 [Mollicutes bacterium]